MSLSEIFATYTAGSTGFCAAVETHCGYEMSRDEIARVSLKAAEAGPNSGDMADEFDAIVTEEFWWTDDGADYERHLEATTH